ncbi:MAG: flagellar protein [Lachnospiraceae bacterium]|nr:flagellar protein [Lachnospiraceae bacterium]
MADERVKIHLDDYNKPVICEVCGGHMIFKGVGEYQCEKCNHLEYDDYGKVRNYIETHPLARKMYDVEMGTGVSRKVIRQLLREERIEVAPDSSVFLKCEVCGRDIRAGRYCPACAQKIQAREDLERARNSKHSALHGFGQHDRQEDGEKRFRRER